jgi:hypothetical protein
MRVVAFGMFGGDSDTAKRVGARDRVPSCTVA